MDKILETCGWRRVLQVDYSGCFLMLLFGESFEASSRVIEALLDEFKKVPSEGRPLVESGRVVRELSRVRAAHRDSDGAAALGGACAAPSSRERAAPAHYDASAASVHSGAVGSDTAGRWGTQSVAHDSLVRRRGGRRGRTGRGRRLPRG